MSDADREPALNPAANFSRRDFLKISAAGALSGLAGLSAAQEPVSEDARRIPLRRRERRTLFFNLSHDPESRKAVYYLVAGERRYRLRKVRNNRRVLRRERRRNGFLRQVPDAALTHFVDRAVFDAGAMQLVYVLKVTDQSAGEWSMVSMAYQLPAAALRAAHELGTGRLAAGAERPRSAKRIRYGLGPALTPQDLVDEHALLDTSDHAVALVAFHPQLMSGDPVSAAHVQQNHIAPSGDTMFLASMLQQPEYGPAMPATTPGQPNATGWGTMTPIIDDTTGQPFRNQKGNNKGLIQYHPVWNNDVAGAAGNAMASNINSTRDDETLGANVTGLDPSNPNTLPTNAIWQRHDGFTTVNQTPAPDQATDPLAFVINNKSLYGGYSCTGSATAQADGSVKATLTFTNWFVRWLGIYILFLDANDKPLNASGTQFTLPSDYNPSDPDAAPKLQSQAALFCTLLGPEYTLFAIPVMSSSASVSFTVPEGASTVRIFASGPSLHVLGGVDPNDPSTWGDPLPGILCTVLLNYGVPSILMVAGATAELSAIQKFALPVASNIVVNMLATGIGDALRGQDFSKPDVWQQLGLVVVKSLVTAIAGKALAALVEMITVAVSTGTAEDAIPVAGQIAQAISIFAGIATLLETTVEIAASPISYVDDLVLTHDLSVTINPDPNDQTFPEKADYYKVTALFDNGGTPTVQTLDLPKPSPTSIPPVVFKNVPLGGQVNVSVGFYSRSSNPGQNDWLAGSGTTGLVDNTLGANPIITIQEYKFPIQATTVYEHEKRTALDASGNHVWVLTPQGPATRRTDIRCGAPGQLCDFRSITVRQGTAKVSGYVGYAWQGYSTGVSGCGAGGQGNLDQMANIGAVNPQDGYATAGCGLIQAGAKLTYSLLSQAQSNFYLDTSAGLVRSVQLDPEPRFDNPNPPQGMAWAALNFTSDALLLHPSGHLVSINQAASRIESLKLPPAALEDGRVRSRLTMQIHAGQGSRPGLIAAPVAAAISPDGVVLVLEAQNNRLQAFDLGGNPVKYFAKQQKSPYFLPLGGTTDPDTVYLDLAVEFTGYLYVLSYNTGTNIYRLDIYDPGQSDGTPISTTQNMNAARLTVDFWRNVYTLNYEVLQLPDGTTPPIAEPSVSVWVPTTAS